MKRRDTLKLGLLGTATLLVNPVFVRAALGSSDAEDPDPVVPPFSVPLTVPPTLKPASTDSTTDYYKIAMKPAAVEILPGRKTEVLTYAGTFPGPTIRARRGRRVLVTYTNQLATPAITHLHGGHVAADSDGYPMDALAPGGSKTDHYPNKQPAATLWYHDHAHHLDSEQVYRGLAGAYLLSDPAELRLPLPKGDYDIPLLIRDARFDSTGQLVYEHDDFAGRSTMLVNGRPQPNLVVKPCRYRLRLINASNMGFYTLALSNGAAMAQIAADGGLLAKPAARTSLTLWPGERAEVLVDFSAYPAGTKIVLENLTPMSDPQKQVMQFEVGTGAAAASPAIPATLAEPMELGTETVTRKFVLSTDTAAVKFLINGREFDPNRADATIKRGSTEIWEITNSDTGVGIPHSMHLHATHFKVLDRNGVPEPAYDAAPKDVVRIPAGDTVRIKATFDASPGRYVFHCHFLDHNANMQMGLMEIID
ncbi:multicopper oxidase family protein [Streptomyces sp. NPDC050759]|uniref:multicopper oxidase family protein n=1 Tax=Streptomyces sp. NPDC050759 TaxID=3365635 RepID=UPI0037A486D8